MNNIFLTLTIQSYVIIAIIVVILLSALIFFLSRKKPIPETVNNLEYFNLIHEALGGSDNIDSVNIAHQRLQVKVVNMKNVSGSKLRELRIPAIVKGKEITLLIKKHTQEVLSYIKDRKKEDF
ncbi:MAG: hypothetical protein CVV61_08435 [Tenericutes bacterium HGW-Tenericutes-6]|jgi:phosphotransferase system IIB component|nr:MAG: hypothetical protein CVV61_08435 [Tenericutes bacterium HGW-Tenericutes-6]